MNKKDKDRQTALHFGCILLAGLLAICPCAGQAQEDDESFHVVAKNLNVEAEKAEFCLTLSRPMVMADRAALAARIRLEKDGVRVTVPPHDLSLTAHDVCVQQLEHRHRYRFVLRNLEDEEGNSLDEPFSATFTIPGRKPFLAFEESPVMTRLLRLREEDQRKKNNEISFPPVRAINIEKAQVTLYQFPDHNLFAEALAQAAKLNLAPSESLYLASQKGKAVWQSELVFSDRPDKEQTLKVPLPSRAAFQPGLYFLAVVPVSANPAGPALMAGQWFLAGDLRLAAMSAPQGVYVFAADDAGTTVIEGAEIRLLAEDGQMLAEGKSDKDGKVFLPFPEGQKDKAALVTGRTTKGDADILDLTQNRNVAFMPVNGEALILPDRNLYRAGATATVMLVLKDDKGKPLAIPASALKLIQPDDNFFSEEPVPAREAGPAVLTMPLPVTREAGVWSLLWQKPDGTVLARVPVRLASDGVLPEIKLGTDRVVAESGGTVTVNLKVVDQNRKPVSWREGKIEIRPVRPAFSSWPLYHFGVEAAPDTGPLATTGFLTLEDGKAQTSFKLPANGQDSPLQAIKLMARLNRGAASDELEIPVKNPLGWIGIRPQEEGAFPENSQAVFDIIAVDGDGKRHTVNDLYYLVYEEGRSFDWFQSGGRWVYRPSPQRRRIGGGRLKLEASGATKVTWPVTAGHYALEVTDAAGNLLARLRFTAGGRAKNPSSSKDHRLTIPDSGPEETKNGAGKIIFKLAESAMVSVVIGDDHVRQTWHRLMKAGENTVTFDSSGDWGSELRVQASAVFGDGGESSVSGLVPLRSNAKSPELHVAVPAGASAGTTLILPVAVANSGDAKTTRIRAIVVPEPDSGKQGPPASVTPAATFSRDGRAVLNLTIPDFGGQARIILTAWNDQSLVTKTVPVSVRPVIGVHAEPLQTLFPGDEVPVAVTLENNTGPEGTYTYTLTVPSGLRLRGTRKGTITLKHGKPAMLSFTLTADTDLWAGFALELKGPKHFVVNRTWPVVAQGNKPLPLTVTGHRLAPHQTLEIRHDNREESESGFILAGPVPLTDVPHLWRSLLRAWPVTPEEVAVWLTTVRLWQKELMMAELINESALQYMRARRLWRLEEMQNVDGGFPSWPGGASTLDGTAAAAVALQGETSPAADRAIVWLRRHLENTWFEESERPSRAAALLALARTGHADLAALRYFADTSQDKKLSPLGMAQTALALALMQDREPAKIWVQKARETLPGLVEKDSPEIWSVLETLAENPLIDVREITGDMEQASAHLREDNSSQVLASLRIRGAMMGRAGAWRFSVDKKERKMEGLAIMPLPEKNAQTVLANPMDREIYVMQVSSAAHEAPASGKPTAKTGPHMTVDRRLYHLDGALADLEESLTYGETYLLVLQGNGKVDDQGRPLSFLVTNPSGAGFRILEVASKDPQVIGKLWPWVPQPLTASEGFSATSEDTTFILPASEEWRIACLFRITRRGRYALPSVLVRTQDGQNIPVSQNTPVWTVK